MMNWMIDTFWACSLLIFIILLIRAPVAQYFGAKIVYALWLIPAARAIMPALYKKAETASNVTPQSNAIEQNGAIDTMPNIINAIPNNTDILINKSAIIAHSNPINWETLILVIWLGVASAIFIIQTARYISMRDEILANSSLKSQQRKVIIIESDLVSGPLAFGIFKKYIAIPQDFEKTFPIGERDMAIAHEMAHHKSGDLIANLFAFIFLCLTWFSPLSWVAWNKFRLDQESACDARVLDGSSGHSAKIYGRALVRSANKETPVFLAALNSPKTILTRLRRLKMTPHSNKRQCVGKAFIGAMIAAVLPITATTISVAAPHAQTDVIITKQPIEKITTDPIETIKTEAEIDNQVAEPKEPIDKAENSIAKPEEKPDYWINSEGKKSYYTEHYKFEQKFDRDGISFSIYSDYELGEKEIQKYVDEAKAVTDKLILEVPNNAKKFKMASISLHDDHEKEDMYISYSVGKRYQRTDEKGTHFGTTIVTPINDEVSTSYLRDSDDVITKDGQSIKLPLANEDYDFIADCSSASKPEQCRNENAKLIAKYRKKGLVSTLFKVQSQSDATDYNQNLSDDERASIKNELEKQLEILRSLIRTWKEENKGNDFAP